MERGIAYNPWDHAEALGIPVIGRPDIRGPENGMYDDWYRAIFLKTGMDYAQERCVLAHEIVHAEYRDRGHHPTFEHRARRISSWRLLRFDQIQYQWNIDRDLGQVCIELNVTEHTMRNFVEHWTRSQVAA